MGCGALWVYVGPEQWRLFTQSNTVQHERGLCGGQFHRQQTQVTEQWWLGSTLRWGGGERPEPGTLTRRQGRGAR